MLRIRLAAEDRERYGLPEWIEYDVDRPKLSEIRKVKAAVDWGWHQLAKQVDADDDDDRLAARLVLWWLAVNRHHTVSWDEFELDVFGVEVEVDNDPNPPAPDGAETS